MIASTHGMTNPGPLWRLGNLVGRICLGTYDASAAITLIPSDVVVADATDARRDGIRAYVNGSPSREGRIPFGGAVLWADQHGGAGPVLGGVYDRAVVADALEAMRLATCVEDGDVLSVSVVRGALRMSTWLAVAIVMPYNAGSRGPAMPVERTGGAA